MDNLPAHMRITGLSVSDHDVDTRRSAISDLKASWAKVTNSHQIVAKAAEIAASLGGDGIPPASLGLEVQAVLQQKGASAFLHVDHPLEVGICAGMAFAELAKAEPDYSGWTTIDLLAVSIWLALSFQPAINDRKREELRVEVLDVARSRSNRAAEKARERSIVGDMTDLVVTIGEENKATTNFKTAVNATVAALRRNAALDREELDFLWWSHRRRSQLLNKQFATLSEPVRLVVSGIEAASYLRRLPCEAHRDVVLGSVQTDAELDLRKLMTAIGQDRAALGKDYAGGIVAATPSVFPLLNALATGSTVSAGSSEKRSASTWGSRALLEAAVVQMIAHGPATL